MRIDKSENVVGGNPYTAWAAPHSDALRRIRHVTSRRFPTRGGTRHRDGGPRPTESLISAQPDPHRPTGACHTTLIIANQHTQPDIRGWTNDGFQEITAEQWCDSHREYRSETHAIMP